MKRGKNLFQNSDKLKSFFKPTKKKTIITIIALVAVLAVVSSIAKKSKKASLNVTETDIVMRGDVDVSITGSSSVEPYERYEIIPKVSGDIVVCPYDVGDTVNEGDLLYGFDTSNTDLTVERQKISLKQSENSYRDALDENDKLYIRAKNDGVISGLSIKAGQEIKQGMQIATIADSDNLEVVLPFTSTQLSSIYVGSPATITSSKHMSSVPGTVSHISSGSFSGSDGTALYNVTITFQNPGVFYSGMSVGGSVGSNVSPGSGVIENAASATVSAETDGTVSKVYHSNGDRVKKDALIAVLTSDTVSDKIENSTLSYQSAKLSMEQTEKDLEDYNITSPISGTVITKNSKAGDTIDKTNSTQTMMVVADISRLKFNLSIDELDITNVTEGQLVSITCDALPNETFEGIITTVSVEGTAQNGVTTYSAEVVIDEPGNLRPSMNIDASIIVNSAKNVLTIPTEDIKSFGSKSFVFVKDNEGRKDEKGEKPDFKDDEKSGEKPDFNGSKNADKSGKHQRSMMPEAPDGYRAVEIEIGLANDEVTEVKSGLTEGQEIMRVVTVSTNDSGFKMGGMSGGMGGGMSGGRSGGMSGGMSGGHPGGGMR